MDFDPVAGSRLLVIQKCIKLEILKMTNYLLIKKIGLRIGKISK